MILQILNNGNIAIASSDFERSLTFTFGSESKILTVELIKAIPNTLKPQVVISSISFELQPTLLNSGDMILLKLLLAQYDGTMQVNARVIGVKEIRKVTVTADRIEKFAAVIALAGLLSIPASLFLSSGWLCIVGVLLFIIGIMLGNRATSMRKQVETSVNK